MVKRHEPADHAEARVGDLELVSRRTHQTFDLSHDVITEVPDDSAVKGRKSVAIWDRRLREEALEGSQDSAGLRVHPQDRLARARLRERGDVAISRRKDEERSATDKGVATPPLATFHRLEQESLLVANRTEEHANRSQRVGHEFDGDGHDAVLSRLRHEPGKVRDACPLEGAQPALPSPGPVASVR